MMARKTSLFFYAAFAVAAGAVAPPPSITLNNGVVMPVLLAGTGGYNSSATADAIRNAMAGNLTSFQTSDNYGNLPSVGEALGLYTRESFFLASMTSPCIHPDAAPVRNVTDPDDCEVGAVWHFSTGSVDGFLDERQGEHPGPHNDKTIQALTTTELEAALSALNVSQLDLVMLHGPSAPSKEFDGACSEDACALNSAQWRAYTAFLTAGKARAIGVSNFCESCLKCLLTDDDVVVPAVNEIQYHVGQGADPTGLLSYTAGLGINVQAYSPLCSGDVIDDADVVAIADAHGKTAAQVGLRFILQNAAAGNLTAGGNYSPSIVTAAEDPAFIAEDLDIFAWALTDAEMATLSAKTSPTGERDGRPCWGCGE